MWHIRRLSISFQAHVNVVYAIRLWAQSVNIIVYGALLWIQTVRFLFPVPPAQRAIAGRHVVTYRQALLYCLSVTNDRKNLSNASVHVWVGVKWMRKQSDSCWSENTNTHTHHQYTITITLTITITIIIRSAEICAYSTVCPRENAPAPSIMPYTIQNTGQTWVNFFTTEFNTNVYTVCKNSWKFNVKIVFYCMFSITRPKHKFPW